MRVNVVMKRSDPYVDEIGATRTFGQTAIVEEYEARRLVDSGEAALSDDIVSEGPLKLPAWDPLPTTQPAVDYFPVPVIRGLADWYQQTPLEYNGFLWAVYWSSAGLPMIASTPCPPTTQIPKLASAIWTTLALDTIGTAVTVATTSVDFGAPNSFTITAHGWVTGTTVKYATGTGSVTGLTTTFTYWVIKLDANTISLASTEDNSIAGTAIDITGVGAGNFTFTPNLPPTGAATDGHLYLTFGFDSAGRIIVFRNAHIGRVHWCYCNVSDATFSTAGNWVVGGVMVADADEDAASYCTPIMCRDGTLLMHYRDGSSGNGDQLMNVWNSSTKTWSRRCQLMGHGSGTTYNAYMTTHVSRRGRIHVAWNWTDTGSATGGTGHDIGYLYTDDNFVNVFRSDGRRYKLPIESATTEKAVTIATGSYLIGPLQMFAHPVGDVPYIAYMKSDGTSSQYYLTHLVARGTWSTPVVLTTWNYLYDIAASPIRNGRVGRPVVVITNSGRVLIVYRNNQQARGAIRCMDVTDTDNISDFPLVKIDFYQKETPRIDENAVIDHNRMHMFLATVVQEGSGAAEDYFNANQWTVQFGMVATVDLSQLDKIAARTCRVPGIELMAQDSSAGTMRPFFFDDTAVAIDTTNTITLAQHGLQTGCPARYFISGGSITGLTSGTTYYVIRVDASTIKLATSAANATAGTAIVFSAVGAGSLILQPDAQQVAGVASPGTQLGSIQMLHTDFNRSDYVVFFKHEIKYKMNAAGTFTVRLHAVKTDGTIVGGDYNTGTSTTDATLKSPWMPLSTWPDTQDYTMSWNGRVSAASASVYYAKMQLGRLALV